MNSESILRLAAEFQRARNLTLSTVSTYATGSGDQLGRLQRGRDITTRRAASIVQWFSDNWPDDLAWPADVPRPAPSPDSPAGRPPDAPADPLAAVVAEYDLMDRAELAGDDGAAKRHRERMLRFAATLGPDGRIASPKAICRALGVRRYVYDDVVRRFADGRAGGKTPRDPWSDTGRVFSLLVASGDVRFAKCRVTAA